MHAREDAPGAHDQVQDQVGGRFQVRPKELSAAEVVKANGQSNDSHDEDQAFLQAVRDGEAGNQGDDAQHQMRPVFSVVEPPGGSENTGLGRRSDDSDKTQYGHEDQNRTSDLEETLGGEKHHMI